MKKPRKQNERRMEFKSYASGDGSISFTWVYLSGKDAGCASIRQITISDILENYPLTRYQRILMRSPNKTDPCVYTPIEWMNNELAEGLLSQNSDGLPRTLHFKIKNTQEGQTVICAIAPELYGDEEPVIHHISTIAEINFAKNNHKFIKAHTYQGPYNYE